MITEEIVEKDESGRWTHSKLISAFYGKEDISEDDFSVWADENNVEWYFEAHGENLSSTQNLKTEKNGVY